jgi:integrase
MASQHLTDATIKRLPAPERGNKITWDDSVAGFGARVTAAGARSFVLNYRTKAGRERRITIGNCDNWTIGAARHKARELRRVIEDGGDPLGEIEEARAAPAMADLAARFVEEHLPRLRPATAVNYRVLIDRHVTPHFGLHTKVTDVRFEDIDALHRKITKAGNPYAANRTVAMLLKMFNLAVRWGMVERNPCKGVEKNPEQKRKRYLSGDELTALTAALAKHPDQDIANVFRLLLLTGARRGEVLAMRWGDIDLNVTLDDGKNGGTWTKPASTTKQKADHVVPLAAAARQLLSEIRQRQTATKKILGEYVFPSAGSTGHIIEVQKSWRRLSKSAGISGLRIHDLRHSFASQLASAGVSLPLIGALLGHSQPATTHRYAHLFQDPQRAAVEKVARIIAEASNGGTEATPPTPLRRPTRGR